MRTLHLSNGMTRGLGYLCWGCMMHECSLILKNGLVLSVRVHSVDEELVTASWERKADRGVPWGCRIIHQCMSLRMFIIFSAISWREQAKALRWRWMRWAVCHLFLIEVGCKISPCLRKGSCAGLEMPVLGNYLHCQRVGLKNMEGVAVMEIYHTLCIIHMNVRRSAKIFRIDCQTFVVHFHSTSFARGKTYLSPAIKRILELLSDYWHFFMPCLETLNSNQYVD